MLCCVLAHGAWQASAWAEEQADSAMTEEEMRRASDAYYWEVVNQPNEMGEYSYFVWLSSPSQMQEQRERRRQLYPKERRAPRYDPYTPETIAYGMQLEAEQSEIIATITNMLGRELRVVRRTVGAFNNIEIWLTAEEADKVASIPGVSRVQQQGPPYYPDSSRSQRDMRARDYVWFPFPNSSNAKGLG